MQSLDEMKLLVISETSVCLQNLADVGQAPSGSPVEASSINGGKKHRNLLQAPNSGVQLSVGLQSPPDMSDAVQQAVQQAVSSGQFQADLAANGTSPQPQPFLMLLCYALYQYRNNCTETKQWNVSWN